MPSAGGEPPTSNCTPAPNGGFVPDFGNRRSFVINEIGGFVFEKLSGFSHRPSASRPLKARLVLQHLAFGICPLPFAFCHSFLFLAYRLLSPFLTTQTVASFLFSARSDPLLSIKSVASFLKSCQLLVISDQLTDRPRRVLFFTFAICHLPLATLSLFLAYRLLAFWPPMVASFLFSARSDPLLSVKSVASFFEKFSAFSR